MAVTKEEKLTYKLKKASLNCGNVIDEDGVLVDIMQDIIKVFNGSVFDITIATSTKEELEVDDVI